ncbi:MAG TPA: sigma-70 family RNA polymerase sigma factor [Candidatus Obscuribacterales bacterium]
MSEHNANDPELSPGRLLRAVGRHSDSDSDIEEDTFTRAEDDDSRRDDSEKALDAMCRKYRPLSDEVQRQLLELAMRGDKKAIDLLVKHNISMADRCARRAGSAQERADLVQEAEIAFLRWLQRSNRPTRRLSARTFLCMRNGIYVYRMKFGRVIRWPVYFHKGLDKVRKAMKKLEERLGGIPRADDIAADTLLPLKFVSFAMGFVKGQGVESLDSAEDDREAPLYLGDIMSEERAVLLDVAVQQKEARELLLKLMGTLSPQEQYVLHFSFGFSDGNPKSLKAIGRSLGLTKEGVRKIKMRALRKLKQLCPESARELID